MSDSEADLSFEEPPVYYELYPRTEKVTCRFGRKIQWSHGAFNKKSLLIAEGTPLPATFPFGMGQFSLLVDRDLSVSFNGEKLPDSLISRVPENLTSPVCGSSGTFLTSTPTHDSSTLVRSNSATVVDLQLASSSLPSSTMLDLSAVDTTCETVVTLNADQAAFLQHHFLGTALQQPVGAHPKVDSAEPQTTDGLPVVDSAKQQPVDALPTVNFLEDLNSNFRSLVIDNLEAKIRETIVKKEDISTRTPLEQKRMRNAVLHQVYGKRPNIHCLKLWQSCIQSQ